MDTKFLQRIVSTIVLARERSRCDDATHARERALKTRGQLARCPYCRTEEAAACAAAPWLIKTERAVA
jgi:hypothetical protein